MARRIDRLVLAVMLGLVPLSAGAAGRGTDATPPATPEAIDWDRLRRSLALPTLEEGAPCPRTVAKRRVQRHLGLEIGDGPAYPAFLAPDGVINYGAAREEGGWFYAKVLWLASPAYAGPLLIRGRQLDGPNEVRFNEGADPPAELRLAGGEGSLGAAPGWRGWPSYTRLRAPGCYAYQVDGTDFSDVIVFQAVEELPRELTAVPRWEEGRPNPLPRELSVASGVRLRRDRVRLALTGADQLVLRLDVWPTQDAPLGLPGQDVERLDTAAGLVLWQAHPEHGWPNVATWDDGRHRYRLEVLDADPDAWSEADLLTLVEAFAAAPEPGEG